MAKPLLLLDVDGVCCPFGAGESPPEDLERVSAGGVSLFLSPRTGERLRALQAGFELWWASGWEERANEHICPLLGLPALPVISFDDLGELDWDDDFAVQGTWKLHAVRQAVRSRPFAWVDDEIQEDALLWAAQRNAAGTPTLLIRAECHRGLTAEMIAELERFAAAL